MEEKCMKEKVMKEKLKYLEDGSLGDLLIVIDLQNVYLENQPWGCRDTMGAWKRIKKLIDTKAVDNVIFTQYLPPKDPIGTWKTYNEENREINENPWMSELIEEVKPYAEQYPVFSKDKYSSYTNEEVRRLAGQAGRVLLAGVVAECCVLFTMLSGIDAGDKMVYLTDACTGLDQEKEDMVEQLARYYQPMHTQVMTCEEYVAEHICLGRIKNE